MRDRVLWDAARAYLERAGDEDVIVEGGLWPDFVAASTTSSEAVASARVVFLVDTGDSAQRLLHIAHTVPGNWIARRGWPDEKIRRFADYNRYRSEQITLQAKTFGYPVVDIADHGQMSGAHDAALTHLTEDRPADCSRRLSEAMTACTAPPNTPVAGATISDRISPEGGSGTLAVGDHRG